jgi:SP family sugar:H+ symporter-like MFS transporter
VYYGAQIFGGVGIGDPLVVQLIIGAVNVVCTFPGLYFAEKFGRRMPLFYGALWQTGWLLIFAIMGTVLDPLENRGAGIAMIVAACMFIASFARCVSLPSSRQAFLLTILPYSTPYTRLTRRSTWGPFAWIVISESFTLRTRAKQASLATAGNWLANWMIAFLTPLAADGIGYAFGFVLVATNLAAALLVWFFLFESVGMSLENVDKMYSDDSLKAWKSRKWVPPGYISRRERIPGEVGGSEGKGATGMGRFSDETARPDMEGVGGGKVPTEVRNEEQVKQTV